MMQQSHFAATENLDQFEWESGYIRKIIECYSVKKVGSTIQYWSFTNNEVVKYNSTLSNISETIQTNSFPINPVLKLVICLVLKSAIDIGKFSLR